MNHEGAAPYVGDLLRGHLTGDVRNEVLSHVVDCSDCKSMSETYIELSAAFLGLEDGPAGSHPQGAEIVDYALDPQRLEPRARERIETHLERCPSCRMEMEATVGAEAGLAMPVVSPSTPKPSTGLAGYRWVALAASIVFAVMAYPAFLGVSSWLGESQTAWPGAATEFAFLQSPQRGSGSALPVIELVDDQRMVPLAIDTPSPDDFAAVEFRFAIRNAHGQAVWQMDRSAVELERLRGEQGMLMLLVPSEVLSAGTYTLAVVGDPAGRAETAFEAPFEVTWR